MASGTIGPAAIGVVGIGGLGALAVQFAKALGHRVVAIDNREEGLALATEFQLKADLVIDYTDNKAIDKVKTWTGQDGLAAIIVCTESVEATDWSLKTLRPHGVAVPLGLPPSGFKIDAFTMIFNELTLKGSLVSTRQQAEDMMKIVADYNIRSHVTTISMEEVRNVTDMYMDPKLKGRIVMQGSISKVADC